MRRNTIRFKAIEEALGHIDHVNRLNDRLAHLKEIIGDTPCILCPEPAKIENFCFGCLEFVCERCSPSDPAVAVAGPHTLDAHREVAAQIGVGGFP